MKPPSVLWLFLSALELQLVKGIAIDNSPASGNGDTEGIDYDLYLRDLPHDEVPPLHHLLAIRDQTSHVPISNTRITPGELLDHILETNPSLKPASVDTMGGKYRFDRYTFNESVWNGGLADMLSHPPVVTKGKLSDLENAEAQAEDPHSERQHSKRVMAQYQSDDIYDTTAPGVVKPAGVKEIFRKGSRDVSFISVDPIFMARCFTDKGKYVYAKYDVLREVSDYYCTLFDVHMYKITRSIGFNDLGEFSLGTIYKAVKLEGPGSPTMRVNFQFIYQPKGYANGQFWYPMSIFTGIQGICNKIMRNFFAYETSPPDCRGGSGQDTRGGWMGIDVGDKENDRMVFRWAVDPYVRRSKEHDFPDPYPDEEKNNGLPRTDPKDIVHWKTGRE
ncbi:hypothetical protein TWF481_009794 [Arthrobotrys musiformis]|uniref:Uncharacterized protein n=1 Tax=Arthrobotrys musiformis TaxID=47236 RepID=A0AAV9W4V1_9PEZI